MFLLVQEEEPQDCREWKAIARRRAKRRKSPWNLLLIPLVCLPWFFVTSAHFQAFGALYRSFHPQADGFAGIVIACTGLLAWMAPSMLFANVLAFSVARMRRVLEAEARTEPGTGFPRPTATSSCSPR